MTSEHPSNLMDSRMMSSLDFDGDYGHTYTKSIRHSVPGYDVLHEIAIAAVRSTVATAHRVLVVGPGPGEQLNDLLNACPDAQFFVLEPSEQMLDACRKAVTAAADRERCMLIQGALDEATVSSLGPEDFNLVICHNVLHLFEEAQQVPMLRLLAQSTAVRGTLLLSSYSEPDEQIATEQIMHVGLQRLRDRGLTDTQVDAISTTRNRVVFSMNPAVVCRVLLSENLSAPLQLYQGLFSRLWLSTRT